LKKIHLKDLTCSIAEPTDVDALRIKNGIIEPLKYLYYKKKSMRKKFFWI